jgi:two-component system LytT family response regulator
LPRERAGCHKPKASQVPVPLKWVAPQKAEGLLEGFCPEPLQEEQIAVNSNGLMLFLRLADVEWLEAVDNCVALHVGKQTHLLRETLAAVAAKLPSDRFLRISPSTLVSRAQIKELQPMFHGRCGVLLHNGTRLTFMRSYLLARHGAPDRAPRRHRRGNPA